MKKKLEAIGDKVLLRRDAAEDRTASGLVLPDQAKQKPARGTVLSVGPKVKAAVREGDAILFGRYSATDFEHEGEEITAVAEDAILGLVQE